MLLDQKIAEYNFECHRKEIERLVKLDEYNYQKEIQKLKNEEKKNDQLHERENIKISDNHTERMKDLTNDENKINIDFIQTIRKYDDEKEINVLKENNNVSLEKE